jgi:hypothetical protein
MKRLAYVLLALVLPAALTAQTKGKGFPHDLHAGTMTCVECHAGIAKGDAATLFPKLETCTTCHDKGVRWKPPGTKGPTGWMTFSHAAHDEIVGKEATCITCHTNGVKADSAKIVRPNPARCESCHDKHLADESTCSKCHNPLSKAVGISLKRIAAFPRPVSHTRPYFASSHGAQSGVDKAPCATCHVVENFCSNCHAGEKNTKRYHPANFAARHAPEAYGRDVECAGCHSTEAFCRSCHQQSGLAAKTGVRNGGRFHNAQPQWLLKHGTAARQELTTCTTCHQQSYCMQCHSNVGWRVSPHGPDFDGARMQKRNSALCLRCHIKDPLKR